MIKLTKFAFMVAFLALSACAPAIVGGAAVTGGVAVAQERPASEGISDSLIQSRISERWFRYNHELNLKLDVDVIEGRAILTGLVDDPEMRVDAVRIAWQVEGVKQVANEIQVAESTGPLGYASDAWITSQIRAKMLANMEVASINYSVETVRGEVYIMGIARSQYELDEVTNIARNQGGVTQVISYVRLEANE